jgi:hypothetical protein
MLLMDEALRVLRPEGTSHAEPQRLMLPVGFALKMLYLFCFFFVWH